MNLVSERRRQQQWPEIAGAARIAVPLVLVVGVIGLALGDEARWLVVPALLLLACRSARSAHRSRAAEQALVEAEENYRGLVDLPAQIAFIVDPEGRSLYLSRRWTELTGLDLQRSAEGEWLSAMHPDDHDRVVESWAASLATGKPYEEEYRIRVRSGRFRWFLARGYPQRSNAGAIVRWVGALEDIHDRRVAEEQLRHTASLLEMIGTSVDSIIYAKDLEGRMLYGNRALEQLAGVSLSEILGKTDLEWIANKEEAAALIEADRKVVLSGGGIDVEEIFTGSDGASRVFRSLKSPLRDLSSRIIGLVGVSSDITEQKDAEQREQLLARELDHRAKNMLAVVQSVVTLTRGATVEEFKLAVEGRLQALARAHAMLADSRWDGADLQRIVEEELAPYSCGERPRVRIAGPSVLLRPAAAQSLALIIHELATNAAKYGALSNDEGEVQVRWSLRVGEAGEPALALAWSEQGGPAIPAPADTKRKGFGTRLIVTSIERQLGGKLAVHWPPEGLKLECHFPLSRSLPRLVPQPAAEQPGTGLPLLDRQAAA